MKLLRIGKKCGVTIILADYERRRNEMNAEEIRKKAIECFYTFSAMCHSKECEADEEFHTICHCEYNGVTNAVPCSAVYGYECGFNDGVEEGKKQTILSKLDIDEQYEVSKQIEAEIRADERIKVLEEAVSRISGLKGKEFDERDECYNGGIENALCELKLMKGEQT